MKNPITALHDKLADLFRRRMFFIGGPARAGTTWLQLMLNAHPAISCRGEGHFCDSLLPLLDSALARHNQVVAHKNATLFKTLEPYPRIESAQGQYLLAATIALLMADGADDAPILGEKTPDNVLAVSKLSALFPQARFITVVRDGRDCAVSAWFHNRRLDGAVMDRTFPTFPDFVAAFAPGWATCVDLGLRYAAAYPQRCTCVSYEALVQRPEATLTRLLTFLEADTAPDLVRACVQANTFPRLSGGRQPGQEDLNSLFRRGEIGDWRRHFTADTLAVFEQKAGAQLQRCGYSLAAQALAPSGASAEAGGPDPADRRRAVRHGAIPPWPGVTRPSRRGRV